jgi:hypothetical protein
MHRYGACVSKLSENLKAAISVAMPKVATNCTDSLAVTESQSACCSPVDSVTDPVPALQAVDQQATRQQTPGCQELVLPVIWQSGQDTLLGNPGRRILAPVCHQLHQQTTLKNAAASHDMGGVSLGQYIMSPTTSWLL